MSRSRWFGFVAALTVGAGCAGGASPAPIATPAPTGLAPGEYTTAAFKPPVTYTLPEGWLIAGDSPDYFALQPVTSDLIGIHLFRSPLAASQALDCPIAPAPGVGTAAVDLVDWIGARPGLTVGDPVAVTLGGLGGLEVDVAIADGWAVSCPFAGGLPTVPLFVSPSDPDFRWVIAGTERLRLAILDVPGNGTIVVDIDAFEGSLMEALLPAASPIVGGMRFGLP